MKQLLIEHSFHIASMLAYSLVEYTIGKSKKIQSNSLIELVINNIWGK